MWRANLGLKSIYLNNFKIFKSPYVLYFIWTVGGQIDGGCMAYCEIMCALPDLSMVKFQDSSEYKQEDVS